MAAKRVEEPVSTSELEKKIATALADKDIASSNLAALIAETDTTIAAADEAAEAEREKALDRRGQRGLGAPGAFPKLTANRTA
jgi:hypothetical protein